MKNILLISFLLISSFGFSQTKIYKDTSVVITATQMNYSSAEPFLLDTTGKGNYIDITSLDTIALYGQYVGDFKFVRNVLITDHISNWDSLTLIERRSLVRYNVYPNGTPVSQLDSCYTLAERNDFRDQSIEALKKSDYNIMTGSSDKYYYETMDSISGAISTVEITTYQEIQVVSGGAILRVALNPEQGATLASAGRSYLSTTGANFLTFGGTNPDDEEAGFNLEVPTDYVSGGRYYIYTITSATTDSIQFEIDITVAGDGGNLSTVDESLAAQNHVGSVVTWDAFTVGPFISSLTYTPGYQLILKPHRDASDSPDTYSGTAYLSLIIFEYNY